MQLLQQHLKHENRERATEMKIKTKRLMFLFGLPIVIIGSTLTLNNLVRGERLWPVWLLVAVGLALLFGSTESENYVSVSQNPDHKGEDNSRGRITY